MNQQPMSPNRNTAGFQQSAEKEFALPSMKQLPQEVKWKCRHCGTINYSRQAELYYWPNRPGDEKKGYVALCTACGCRHMVFSLMPPPPPPPPPHPEEKAETEKHSQQKDEREKTWKIVLGAAAGVIGVVICLLITTRILPYLTVGRGGEAISSSQSVAASSSSGTESSAAASSTGSASETSDVGNNTDTDVLESFGLGAMEEERLSQLPNSVVAGDWQSTRKVQGIEWNTDRKDPRVYFSIASYLVSCDQQGRIKEQRDTKGYFFSMDYYDNKLFCVWRSPDYGKFKLKVIDSETLHDINSVDLADIHKKFVRDKEEYGDKLCASIDGIVVAPKIGSQDELMVYVSYNSYVSTKNGIARNDNQILYEYSYDDVIHEQDSLKSKRRLSLDLGHVEYGIQTLELDRSTGNIWCAIRQGYSDYSLYLVDGKSKGIDPRLIPNGDRQGWNCKQAGDGLCSLGHGQFYVLIPTYIDGWLSVEVRKVALEDLEQIQQE